MIKRIVAGIAVGIGIIVFFSSFETVNEGTRGLVFNMGRADRVVEPGFYWLNPFTEDVKEVDVTTVKVEGTASAATKDLQNVTATIAVNYEIDPTKIVDIYKQYNLDYESRVIVPAIQEEVKAATAKYTAEEVITKRQEVRDAIFTNIKTRVAQSNLVVKDVLITNFDFSTQFNVAIEAKVKAEQDALKAKNDLVRIQAEADQRVATAKAEAEAIKMQSDAAQNPRYVELKQVEAQLKFAEKWDGKLPVNIYGSAPIPFLNLSKD